jgi:hypothetical protein
MRHTVKLQSAIYDPLIATLEQGPKTLREIMNDPAFGQVSFNRLVQALTFLVALGTCHPCLPDHGLAERTLQTDRFNKAVAEQARVERKFGYFASPLTGGGIAADRMAQLMWLARHVGETDTARFVEKVLSDAGQRLLKDGKPLSADEHLTEIRQRVVEFEQDLLGVWSNLGLSAVTDGKVARPRRIRA